MHKLSRQIRFSINPFLEETAQGFNSYASKPAGEGLALYFALWVELAGRIDGDTGFLVNVADIDKPVRKYVVPIFAERVAGYFKEAKYFSLEDVVALLRVSWKQLSSVFKSVDLTKLTLELNPFRKLAINSENCRVMYFSEKFEFAAMHMLWNEKFSRERNFELFGKCANPAGHGHNYVIEVTIEQPSSEKLGIGEFERIVDREFVRLVDHKNLNVDVPELARMNPTVENIAAFAWEKLAGRFGSAELYCVTIWETDRMYCSYFRD